MPTSEPTKVSEAALEAAAWFFDNSDDVFIVIRDSRVERLNPVWRALTGWPESDVIGRSFWDFVHPDDHIEIGRAAQELTARGATTYEHRVSTAAGGWLWMRSRVKLADDGCAIVVLQDIHEARRQAKAREQASQIGELLRMTSGVSLWLYDPQHDYFDLDPPTAADRGPNDMILRVPGPLYRDSIHPDDNPAVQAAWDLTLDTGEPGSVEYRNRFEGGEWRRLRTVWMAAGRAGNGQHMISGLTQDVTDLTAARDAAVAAAETKGRFLANISHELRTPMNGVLGVLHLLKAAPLVADRERLLDQALSSGATLAQLLNDLVTFAELDSGDARNDPAPTDVAALVGGVVGLVRDDAEAKGLVLDVAISPFVGWRMVDAARLRQVMFNVLGNAVKFTLKGSVSVAVEQASQRLLVTVTDTGVGIPKEAQGGLFERFEQVDGSSTRRFGGSGLGLAICKRLAHLMDGDVGFVSQAGRGSTFWVEVAAPPCEAKAEPAEAGSDWLQGLRILVVEDNPTNRLVATRMLSQLGAQVSTAEDGLQGYEAARRQAFDLIFMDIQMPVMDGLEATRKIRALPGALGQTPIVALTANVLKDQVARYQAVGMNGCLAKPLSPASLMTELSRLANDDTPADDALTA